MKNKTFVSELAIIFILFVAVFGSAGCRDNPKLINNNHDDSITNPEPDSNSNNGTTFTVTFDSNGGSEVPSKIIEAGGTVTMPDAPTKDGYVFAGWFTDNVTFENAFTFGIDGDKVTQDITLYAQWVEYDTLITENAINEVVIGYSKSDNENHVTENLTLPTKIYSADISWISSSSAVSSNGTVTRQATDTEVTLTATATYNGKESEPKTFTVRVIRKRTRNNSEIKALPINEAKSGDIVITRNASENVIDIDGMYVNFDINNVDDALDAVTVLREELGIKNPSEELDTFLATSDKYSSEFAFSQVYKGVKVWGRNLVVSTNSSGKGDFLHSSFVASNVIAKADGKNDIGSSVAESKAKGNYSGEVEVDSALTEKIIYSLENYENDPVYAYIVRTFTVSEDKYLDESVFVNADTGEIIKTIPNAASAFGMKEASGTNELGDENIPFEVLYDVGVGGTFSYYMKDINLHVQLHNNVAFPILNLKSLVVLGSLVQNVFNKWEDTHNVSVYSNMLEIMKWWKKKFNRNALDNCGNYVDVIVHAWGNKDNAAWCHRGQFLLVNDLGDTKVYAHSHGAAVDILTHETTHAVLQYITGELPYEKEIAAINEGYADIFACIKDENWQFGEKIVIESCLRDIKNPSAGNALTKSEHLYTPVNDVHEYFRNGTLNDKHIYKVSYKVSHAAYLMHVSNDVNGLTWEELGKVWYKSMHKGLDATSRFEDVQRCVMAAARELHLSSEKLFVIESAFSQLGYGSTATLTGTVTDYDTKLPMSWVGITSQVGQVTMYNDTGETGNYSIRVPVGNCTIAFDSKGYITFSSTIKLEAIAQRGGNVLNVALVKAGAGSVSGTAYNARTFPTSTIEGVTVKIRRGHDVNNGEVLKTTTTDSNGRYSFDLGENGAGYYTIEMTKNGYKAATFNVTVGRNTTGQNGYLIGGSSEKPTSDEDEKEPEDDNNNNEKEPEEPDWSDTPDISEVPIDAKHFPDEGFLRYIRNEIDTNNDRILSKNEIAKVTRIDLHDFKLTSSYELNGIEYFSALQVLDCSESILRTLDVSKNTALQVLDCHENELTALDVSKNTALQVLYCSNNNLTVLDVSKNTALQKLDCSINKLTVLDVTKNSALQVLDCQENYVLTVLDVSKCTALQELYCNNNELKVLDVSKNSALQVLDCQENYVLTVLDVSKNTALQVLDCSVNELTVLDVTKNSALQVLYCSNNNLTVLDVSKNTALQKLICYVNKLTVLDVSKNMALQELYCNHNKIATLDLRNCIQLNSNNVVCDDNVKITWPASSNSVATNMYEVSKHVSSSNSDYTGIIAFLPPFKASYTGIYSFDISFDMEIPSDSVLIMHLSSDDASPENESCIFFNEDGSQIEMPLTNNVKYAKVAAHFEEGITYSPVIIAQSDEALSNSGGCNAGMFGIFILLTNIVFLKKR